MILCCILNPVRHKLLSGAPRLFVDFILILIMADPQGVLNTATNNTSANLAPPSPAQRTDYNTRTIKCAWCLDPILSHDFFISQCHNPGAHFICYPCIRQVFNLAADDGSMSAPRCCGTLLDINRRWLRVILGTELVAKYTEARKGCEDENHTRCSACSAVIPYSSITIDKFAKCTLCNTASCTWCKKPAHEGQECLLSQDERATTALAQAQGWQRCFRCGRWIDRKQGCSHIT